MSQEITKPTPNPWETYGASMRTRSFIGTLLKFNKGDFLAGQYDDEVRLGTTFVAVMDQLLIGWQRWDDGHVTDPRMGLLIDGFVPPKRNELSDPDESTWPLGDDGEPRDPWQFANFLVLVGPDEEREVYTFTTATKGGLGAIGELCKAYGAHVRQKPDEYPRIKLGVGSYQHKDRQFGRIKFPVLEVVGWVDKGDFLEIVAAASTASADTNSDSTTSGAAANGAERNDDAPRF